MVVESHNTPEDSSVVPQTAPKKKPVRGSHRVMTASGRVPNRLVFGKRIAKNFDPGTSQTHFSPMIAPVVRALRKFHPEEDRFFNVPLRWPIGTTAGRNVKVATRILLTRLL